MGYGLLPLRGERNGEGNASPNVPFAALTPRWAIDELGFQPVFGALTKLTQMYPNKIGFSLDSFG